MSKINNRQLKRVKQRAESSNRLQKKWDKILTTTGLSMNRGLSDRLSYVGTSADLGVIEKLNQP